MNICTLRGITDKREKNLQHRVNVQTTDAHHTNRFNQPHAKISLVKVNFSAIFFGCLLQGVKIDFVCHLCAIDWNHGHKMNLQPLALDLLLWYFFSGNDARQLCRVHCKHEHNKQHTTKWYKFQPLLATCN